MNTVNTVSTGNTLVLPVNTHINKRSRGWVMTLNHYTDEEYTQIHNTFEHKKWDYIIGKEIGENKTPHLQMYIYSKNALKFSYLKKLNNRLHIEAAKGNKIQNIQYCKKDNNYVTNIITKDTLINKILKNEYKNVKWKQWQSNILATLNSKPHNREILWFYDYQGNKGKSYLCKYICCTLKGVIIGTGKKNDIFNQINNNIENNKNINIVILDIPRHDIEFINYGGIEQIKNGCIYSGKYEGGQCLFEIPHVLIFANTEPDYKKWSRDRYNVICLDTKLNKVLNNE